MQVPRLYRCFLKEASAWPSQSDRSASFKSFLIAEIKNRFRSGKVDLDYAHAELLNLRKLLNNELGDSLALSQTSLIRGYLPPKKQYELLNKESQEYMSRGNLSVMSFIRSKISGMFK